MLVQLEVYHISEPFKKSVVFKHLPNNLIVLRGKMRLSAIEKHLATNNQLSGYRVLRVVSTGMDAVKEQVKMERNGLI